MRRKYNNSSDSDSIVGCCGCGILIFLANIFLGGTSVNYLLMTFLEKILPFGWAVFTGLFVGEFTIPLALVVWILKHFGII